MHCLLIGNGFNRLSMQLSWPQLLAQLTNELGLDGQIIPSEKKPLSLFFEELCVRLPEFKNVRSAELHVKKRIAELVSSLPPHAQLGTLVSQFSNILTTNYDVAVEVALADHLYSYRPTVSESRYSLFRKNEVGTRHVWHIHGDAMRPATILLGYDQYAGYLQKIRNYVTKGLTASERKSVRLSVQERRMKENATWEAEIFVVSWVDIFLRDHLHIVGFGFDFTEIDLWWLLLYKRRRDTRTGKTFFYCIDVDGSLERSEAAKFSLFRSLGVEIIMVPSESYERGYASIIDLVRQNIVSYPQWLITETQTNSNPSVIEVDIVPPKTVERRPTQRRLLFPK